MCRVLQAESYTVTVFFFDVGVGRNNKDSARETEEN